MKTFKILFILSAMLLFSTCSRNNEPNVIKFWHFWSEPNQKKAVMELVKEFENKYHCKVETTELSWNDGKTKLMASFNSRTAPDVLELGSDWVAQFSSSGVLLKLSPDSMNINKYVEFAKAPSYWKNNLYAIPWTVDTRVLFYNKDLMKKAGLGDTPPATIEQMVEFSEKMNGVDGCYGFGANGSDAHRLYKKILYFMWSYGGDALNNQGLPILSSRENISALNIYLRLSRAGIVETQRQLDAMFSQGKIGFWISGGWLLEKIKNENPNFNFGVSVLPGTNSQNGMSFAGGEYLSISSTARSKELSKKFVQFMTDGMNSIKFCKNVTEAGFPAEKKYFNDNYYSTQKYRKVFLEQLQYARMTPVNPQWLDIEPILEDAVVEVLYAKTSADGALTNAQEEVLKILKK